MPGAGTDKTKRWIETPAPVVILVEPQLGDNIGATARAMANFGLSRLRLVKPRDGWPNAKAQRAASGADVVLDKAKVFASVGEAVADLERVVATTARNRELTQRIVTPRRAAADASRLAGVRRCLGPGGTSGGVAGGPGAARGPSAGRRLV